MSTSDPATIRLAHPLAFATFLRQIGADAGAYFQRSKLPAMCEDPHALVTLGMAWDLFADAVKREDPDFGWYVGRLVGDQQLNLTLLRDLEQQPTLYEALKVFIAKASSESSQLRLHLVERERDVLLCTAYEDRRGMPGYHASQGYQLELYLDLIRHFVGRDWSPPLIGVETGALGGVIRDRHASSRVLLGHHCGFLSIPRSLLASSARHRHDASHPPAPLTVAGDLDYNTTLRLLLKPYLPERRVCAVFAADLMGVSLRTQGRYLQQSGTTLRKLIDELRLEVAYELLADDSIPIGDIAGETGFNDPAHFTRMFRRLTGMTARQYRQLQSCDREGRTSHIGAEALANRENSLA